MDKIAKHVAIEHHLMAAGGDMTKRITEIKMPILIMFGENSPLSKKEQMNEMKALLPNAKLVMFEGYGHGINLLIPDRCVAEMQKFLNEHATVKA
jgi:pimeloyl-ACP methyl ester carboxylesterase